MTRKVVKNYRRLIDKIIKLINEMTTFEMVSTEDIPSYSLSNIDYPLTRIKIKNILTNVEIGIVIQPHDTLDNISKTIILRFNNMSINQLECPICYDLINKTDQVPCNKCACYTCINCYINMFKINNGILTCYSCKNEIGVYHPPHMIDIAVNEIRQKYRLYQRHLKMTDQLV